MGGQNLVQDYSCQCNYQFKTYPNGWGDWVKNWVSYNKQKSGFEWRTWFGQAKAPAWGADSAACWVNNPRDMINLQNALYAQRQIWNNQLVPTSSWDTGSSAEDRKYWGWNEVPADASFLTDPTNWDTVFGSFLVISAVLEAPQTLWAVCPMMRRSTCNSSWRHSLTLGPWFQVQTRSLRSQGLSCFLCGSSVKLAMKGCGSANFFATSGRCPTASATSHTRVLNFGRWIQRYA